MNLDWDFYFDSWLIDKIPDGMEIKIEEHPSGVTINPSELTCYFGANPIYMYGVGKLYHEVLVSPTGIAIYPEFLERPGFEFVEEITFKADFEKAKDYWGKDVVDKHVGFINALEYMNLISKTLYGVEEDGYVGVGTPSSKLRKLRHEDYLLQQEAFDNYQVFDDAQAMRDAGCSLYLRMDAEHEKPGPYDLISGTYLQATAPGAIITSSATFSNVMFLKYTYIELPASSVAALSSNDFQILFGTAEEFRPGTLFDFGSTSNSTPPNYGFRVDMATTGITIFVGDGDNHIIEMPFLVDFRFSHRFSIVRSGTNLIVVLDGEIAHAKTDVDFGNIVFDASRKNYISARAEDPARNVPGGDIEELAIFSSVLEDDTIVKYYDNIVPLIKKGGLASISYADVPVSLSYDLTYAKPTEFFIPNFFKAKIDKFYLVDAQGIVNIIGGNASSSAYIDGYEPIEDKSVMIKKGFRFDNVTTFNFEENIDFAIGERIPVLTKLTSDVHIPLRIYMKFKIPSWHNRKIIYNIRLVLKSMQEFLWYSYKKYKTGEFV